MYVIDQDIANQIARSQKLSTVKMQTLFSATKEEADELESTEKERIAKIAGGNVARGWVMYYPLLFENVAITKFINKRRAYGLRNMMPEILTSTEAALIAQMDIRLTEEETIKLKELFDEENELR